MRPDDSIYLPYVNWKFRTSVHDVRAHRGAAGFIGTDHHLLRAKFVKHVRELGTEYFQQENNDEKRKEWLTDEILGMVKKKSEAYLHWQNRLGKHNEQKYRSKYRALAKLVKRKIEARQFEYWDEISCEIENAIKQHDPATAYAMIRRLRGRNKNMDKTSIQDKNDKMLLNSKDRLSRWREYFCELLNVHTVIDPTILQQIPIPAIDKAEETRQDTPPSLPEVVQAIKQMKSRKASGKDDVTAELLKADGMEIALWLHQIIVDVWINEEMVEDWTMAILIRLYKNKGDKRIYDNYRGISLLIVVSKIFSRIILNRIQGLLDKKLIDQQAGFRPNRSTVDQIFTLKMIMEKSQEHNKSLFMCFIDIQKAYEVNRELLWKVCRHYGLSEKLVRMLKLIYTNTKAQLRIDGDFSETFDIETGIQQGGIPSPVLFNLLFDFIMRKILAEVGVSGVKLAYGNGDFYHSTREAHEDIEILDLIYADDVVAMCTTAADLEKFIRTFEKVTQECGLTMSVKKTCIMSLKQLKEDASRKVIKDQEVDNVKIDITIRNQTRKCVRIFRACILPVLLYGSEVWSLTLAQERRLNTFYMACLRTLVGITLGDRMSNEKLLELSGQQNLENIMRRNRLRWFGHVNRMEDVNKKPKLLKKVMFLYFPDARRLQNTGVGKRWEDKIADDIAKFGIKN
ncbi:unnamed protein product [Didymodactylos carnosus]|uniref:Reverse transcriptase domain-containing protein n=1 Tax=Didymodactylos carnosus TaxID=1234261 RepID=A0A8S2H2E6_9BILA|nr:unnamed protein product [Didymodactylos carnosus]CAF3584964.1 unnamed protein product [Didymodactylos carnosus]